MLTKPTPDARLFAFIGGNTGPWLVDRVHCVTGEPMAIGLRVSVVASPVMQQPAGASWLLRGIRSNERYVMREEKSAMASKQEGLGRKAATRGR